MPGQNVTSDKSQQLHRSGSQELGKARAQKAGADFEWHFGRVTRLGNFELAGGREVVIAWDEGGVSSQQGDLTDGQWEVFKLAFSTAGRVAVLSDEPGDGWMYDYRFLEAVR